MNQSVLKPSQMDGQSFMDCFGDLYEHSPWIAEAVYRQGLNQAHDHPAKLHLLFTEVVLKADLELQLSLLNAHPDLVGRAALAGSLTDASTAEQSSAGLDQCTAEELARFKDLNKRYKAKFNFPFILAVKGSDRQAILAAFSQRIENDKETEFNTALEQVCRIGWLRLQALFGV